jgi:hypothetical protein
MTFLPLAECRFALAGVGGTRQRDATCIMRSFPIQRQAELGKSWWMQIYINLWLLSSSVSYLKHFAL